TTQRIPSQSVSQSVSQSESQTQMWYLVEISYVISVLNYLTVSTTDQALALQCTFQKAPGTQNSETLRSSAMHTRKYCVCVSVCVCACVCGGWCVCVCVPLLSCLCCFLMK